VTYGITSLNPETPWTCKISGDPVSQSDLLVQGSNLAYAIWDFLFPCYATHHLGVVSIGPAEATVIDSFEYDHTEPLTQLKVAWGTVSDISDAIGTDSITSGLSVPDSLKIVDLTPETDYFYWWILYNGDCGADTSYYGTFTTSAGAQKPFSNKLKGKGKVAGKAKL
jgi:hypothetical protein